MEERDLLTGEEEEEAELCALKATVAVADADPRRIPHERVRTWLLRLAEGDFDAKRPEPD